MGKNLLQQARGHGGPTYRAPSFRYKGIAALKGLASQDEVRGKIIDIVKCPGHSSPLAEVQYTDGETCLILAPEGICVGDEVSCHGTEVKQGNTLFLKDIPEGTLIYNIEQNPGDGGKFCRASGTAAKLLSKLPNGILVQLPSKKTKTFQHLCRANVGVLAGGGRKEKPFLKAGNKYHYMKARNKKYPHVSGISQNAVDHPFGGKSSKQKGRPLNTPRNAPPGRKVGLLRARRTGRKKR